MLRLIAAALLLAMSAAGSTALARDEVVHFEPVEATRYDLSRRSVLQLLCHDPQNGHHYLSRVVALDYVPEQAGYDVLLAARHAVRGPDGLRDCWLRGVPQDIGRIVRTEIGNPTHQDPTDFTQDWAILQTAGRLSDEIVRLEALVWSGTEDGALTMPVRWQEDAAACPIVDPPPYLDDPSLIIHECESRSGFSGTPLVTQLDGQVFVVGVHVARVIFVGEDGERYGVARRLSDDFLQALVTILEEDAAR